MDSDKAGATGYVLALGGVARVGALVERGCSRYRIDQALAAQELVRVRRDWVAVADADVELVAAARAGVVLSCITAARRRGLWVLNEQRPHVAARPHGASAASPRAYVHWARPLVPRSPDALEDGIENTLVLVAACRPFEIALAIWESAVRQGQIEVGTLGRLPLTGRARAVLAAVDPFGDSGLETLFRVRLRWLGVPIRAQVWLCGHRVDFLVGDRLVVQIDGGHHVGVQRTSDIAHDAELMLRGYHVLRFGYAQIVDAWPLVQDTIMRAIAQGLHRA